MQRGRELMRGMREASEVVPAADEPALQHAEPRSGGRTRQ